MAEYNDLASEMRDRLNAKSPSLCLAKWLQVSLHLPQGMTQSCYHPPTHTVPLDELAEKPSALHNTKFKIQERRLMLEGERPEGCAYCWRIEDADSEDPKGHLSDRHYRSSEWWAAPDFDQVVGNDPNWDVKPRYVEVNFNQACNFRCMYCSPHLSTTWQDEVEKWGPYRLKNLEHNNIAALEQRKMMPLKVATKDNPYVDAFWRWWPDVYRNLRVFRMTGGEPLMDKNTFRVLEYVNENPHGQLELSITSNMCPPDQKLFDRFIDVIKKCEEIRTYEDTANFNENSGNHWYVAPAYKHFMLFVSLDGFGAQAEYMRTGMEFERLLNNVRTFLRETKHTSVSFINTFNLLSIPSLRKFMDMILELRQEFGGRNQIEFEIQPPPSHGIEHTPYRHKKFQRVWFDIPLLRYPNWFSIQNAGAWGVNQVEQVLKYLEENVQDDNYLDTFEGFKPYEILKLKRDLAVMKQPLPYDQQVTNKTNFYLFIREYDRRRGTNFAQTFPEMRQYYQDCMTAATRQ